MITIKARSGVRLGVAMATFLSVSVFADTIYDNSINDRTNRFNTGTLEVGDEINLAGTARYLTNFSFEYYGLSTGPSFAGTIQAQVRFYKNLGPLFGGPGGYPMPSDMFFDSGLFPVGVPTDRLTFVFKAGADFPTGGLFIPADTMTWSVQFFGMGAGDELGVDIYDPPVVGSSLNDYWENDGGWQLKTNVVNMNFASKFQATPEPSSVALLVLGGLGLLYASRRNHKP